MKNRHPSENYLLKAPMKHQNIHKLKSILTPPPKKKKNTPVSSQSNKRKEEEEGIIHVCVTWGFCEKRKQLRILATADVTPFYSDKESFPGLMRK